MIQPHRGIGLAPWTPPLIDPATHFRPAAILPTVAFAVACSLFAAAVASAGAAPRQEPGITGGNVIIRGGGLLGSLRMLRRRG